MPENLRYQGGTAGADLTLVPERDESFLLIESATVQVRIVCIACEGKMMTTPIYHVDSYVKEFEAHVIAASEDGVVLDQSAFYPGGGGQARDEGTLSVEDGEATVVKFKREQGRLWHVLDHQPFSEPHLLDPLRFGWKHRRLVTFLQLQPFLHHTEICLLGLQ